MKKFVPSKGSNDKVVISMRIDTKLLETIDRESYKIVNIVIKQS